MRMTLAISAILLAGLASGPQTARGQMSSSSGTFGSRSFGSSLSSSSGSSFGSSLGSSGSGMSGLGGQSGFGSSSSGFGSQTGSMGGQSSVGGQSRQAGSFIGVSSDQMSGRNFIGAAAANGATGTGQGMQGLSGNTGMQGLNSRNSSPTQGNSGQSQNGQGNGQGNGRSSSSIRMALVVGFQNSSSTSRQFNSSLAVRLAGLPGLHWRTPSQIEIQGRLAILRGSVATEHDRDLAERVARLEAGVDQVQNQLVVASSATPAKTTGAASPASHSAPADSTKAMPAGTTARPAASSLPGLQ